MDIETYIFNLFVGADGYDLLQFVALLLASSFVAICWS